MNLFKIHREKAKQDNQKLIGVYVPQSVDEHLTLYCLADGTNKSTILRSLLTAWFNNKTPSIKACAESLKVRLARNWDKMSEKQPMSHKEYLATARKELESKGISEPIIKQILNEKD